MHGAVRLAFATFALAAVGCASSPRMDIAPATTPAEAGLVDVRTLVPDIDLDMRYAGTNNFTGAVVDGYGAPRCYLLEPAAKALQRAETALRARGYRLRLFDCYRPARAVRSFVAWAGNADESTRARFYPALEKRDLLGGYISPTSGHSRGATVDLTLLRCEGSAACVPLDMGTQFDFFDPLANTDSPRITPAQRANRERLRDAMRLAGLKNYPMEWWHFTLDPEPAPKRFFDVPIE
ncbi:M15 family metallopeptidase [Lysobacter auxotrophicus]|uniref:D-alanyl-D-alanine dipeptidase n=1 Tax=Lysobacter auxotrophicus TaxID=2992573 RepID=A0ABM8DF04_9GAMM|nr:M15 family metallopeptidase [Lysobacter auxotrophicus]BDU17186.1 M15 family metallopeptidase [Lysobacter auxotrophicus]